MDNTRINLSDEKFNISGISVDVASFIGDAIADKFMSQITEEELQLIVDNAKGEIWGRDYNNELVLKKKPGKYYNSNPEDVKIVAYAKESLNNKLKEYIVGKIDEYTSSDEYKNKAEAIVKEIIDYALEGYKTDMINTLRKRLAIDPLTDGYENFAFKNDNVNDRLNNLESMVRGIVDKLYN